MEKTSLIADRFRQKYGALPHVVASAPGRVNLIGEHTDYNDGFVLPMAIDCRLRIAVAPSSTDPDATQCAGEYFEQDKGAHHRALLYMAGVMWALRRDHSPVHGVDAFITSTVPVGAGLASSAALEIAYARALCETAKIPWEPMVMAKLAQDGETTYLKVRCGIMDQAASASGRAGHAMLLDCRTLEMTHVPMPASATVVVMDTGTRRTLGETEYNKRRASCEEAVQHLQKTLPHVRALRDVTLAELARASAGLDPETLRRAQHVVAENQRPAAMAAALRANDVAAAGALMNESHASLRDLYEVSSKHLDIICQEARKHPACLGARMTGAGFGGCAIALVKTDAVDDFIRATQPTYEARSYQRSAFFPVRADDGARVEPLS
jgi:galactokinase